MVKYGTQVSATCSTVIRIVIAYFAASMISPAFSATADTPSTRRVPASITSLIAPRVSRLTSARHLDGHSGRISTPPQNAMRPFTRRAKGSG